MKKKSSLNKELIMRITTSTLVVFLSLQSLFALNARGQSLNEISINLNKKSYSLTDLLTEIENKTHFNFVLSEQNIDLSSTINVKQGDENMLSLLEYVSKKIRLHFYRVNSVISVTKIKPGEKAVSDKAKPIQFIVSGKVTDTRGEPLIGVTVRVQDTNMGTSTDVNGSYKIQVNEGEGLEFTYLGFKKETVAVNPNQTVINITLTEETSQLSEVVLVGYGSAKREDLTGSVSSIKAEEIEDMPVVSVDNAMVGKASGVQIIKADGSPGGAVRIKVRGGTSLLGGNDPLYVIDGVPVTVNSNSYINDDINIVSPVEAQGYGEDFTNTVSGAFARGVNSLAGLNINDIASIDILKDASATAIYGSKAANGVVIITTKSGSYNQKMNIGLNHYTSISTALTQDAMNAGQFREFYTVSAQNLRNLLNDGTSRPYLRPNPYANMVLDSPGTFFGSADTDWVDMVTRTAITNNTDISIKGGGQNTRYYTSLSFMEQEGTIINTGFRRLSTISKLDNKFSDRFSISTKIGLSFSKNDLTNGVYGQALLARPDYPVFDENGNYSILDTDYTGVQNPIAVSKITNQAKTANLNGYISAQYSILDNLKLNSTFSADYVMYRQKRYVPSFVDIGGFYGRESNTGGRGSRSQNESLRTVFENYITWDATFNPDNLLTVVAGTAWEQFDSEFFSASGQGYPDDDILNNLGSAANATRVDGGKSGNSLLSFYGRANYNYKNKYLLTFTGRADASSKFSPDNRWAIFPSGAIAWKISEENFLKSSSWIDELKFRASMGLVGTQNIGDYLYRTLYDPRDYAGSSATIPVTLGNNGLKWEETLQKDIALDYSFFNNRISGTFGYYYKKTDGQLLNISVAPSSGFPSLVTNIATINNKGWEVDINADIVRGKNFKWNMSLNLSKNISKVTNIDGGPFSNPYEREALNLGTSIVKEGEPLGLLYGRVSKGLIKNEQELQDYADEIVEKLGDGFWPAYLLSSTTVGSVRYAISEEDIWEQDIIGNSNPDVYGGFANTFTYKNFSLYTLFNYSFGNELIWQRDVLNAQVNGYSIRNLGVEALDYYSASNTNTNRPLPVYGELSFLTNDNVYNASFVKLKQLTLNYAFSKDLIRQLRLNNASVYLSATNLFTITDYPGLDPEVSDDPKSIIGGGRDTDNYPLNKTIALGIKIGL